MAHTVDARGLACPQPVILTKKALELHDEVIVLISDATARENVKKLAASLSYPFVEEQHGKETWITITRVGACPAVEEVTSTQGPLVLVVSSETMGSGDDTLGTVLMKSFIHTLLDTSPRPEVVVFFNSAVRLAVAGSEVLDDLKSLAETGVNILVCGTCLNYFGITDRLAVGQVSNMYDIARNMMNAGRLVRI